MEPNKNLILDLMWSVVLAFHSKSDTSEEQAKTELLRRVEKLVSPIPLYKEKVPP
jgi:hypothetical protein